MFLRYRAGTDWAGGTWVPRYDWYEVTRSKKINRDFSIGKCAHQTYVLFHTETLQAIAIGEARHMKELAKKMEEFTFNGETTWTKKGSTIRSLQKIQAKKE